MTTRRPLVIVTRKLPEIVETRMMELFNARLNLDDAPMTQAQLAEAVKSAEFLVPTVTDRIFDWRLAACIAAGMVAVIAFVNLGAMVGQRDG